MPRIARLIAPGYPHHIVQRGNNRAAVFFGEKDRVCYLSLLEKFKKEYSCTLYAYCLMTNHIHLLITPKDEDALAKLMQKVSLCYTQYVNRTYQRTGRLWECRFHSTIVDTDEYFWSVYRYIVRNPVRVDGNDRYHRPRPDRDDTTRAGYIDQTSLSNPEQGPVHTRMS